MSAFNEDDVARMLVNPIYAGIGPYPAIIEDEVYVQAAKNVIQEKGIDFFLRTQLAVLRASFEIFEVVE
jgi:hypothetical protein